jgi:hypothetical protein
MSVLFQVIVDYDVLRAGRHGRPATTALCRGAAAIEIATVRSVDLPVAYRVKHRSDLGPGRRLVLRHGGKLWRPLVDTTFPLITRTARDFLRELRAGKSDLFVRRDLDHPFRKARRWRAVIHDGHDEAVAAVHRNAANLLIVDDGLYAAGGVPLLVDDVDGSIRIASTGANRGVAAPAGALRIKAANDHWGGRDRAICSCFCVPNSPGLDFARRLRPHRFRGIAIETLDGDIVDPVAVRVDAAFRAAWTAMNQSIPRTRPEGFENLRAEFAEACGPGEDDHLTAARYRVRQRFVELFGAAEPKPVAVRKCLYIIRQTISDETEGGVPDPRPKLSLTDADEAALACLV